MRISDWSSDVCSSDLRIVWAFDARMAEIIRSTREPMIGQMRLTWWREALTKDPKVEGSGEPLMDALRSEERRVGIACVSTCRYRWTPSIKKKHCLYNG